MESYLLYIFINSLPLELMEVIRKYTYKPQPKSLLNQITKLYTFKKILYSTYTLLYNYELDSQPNAIENWIDNDITLYLNDDQGTMYGYRETIYDVLSRNYVFNTKDKIINYLNKHNICMDSKTNINIYLSLMNNNEITQLVKYINKTYSLNL